MGATRRQLVVVSNTSPLTNLAAIGQFDLLQRLFGQVTIAASVASELRFGNIDWPGATELRAAAWIDVQQARERLAFDALRLDLDAGEAETIALALQMNADLVLLDERAGRLAAQFLGLTPMGVVGILLRAKQQKLLPAVRPLLDALRHRAGFFLDAALYSHALNLAGELT